MKKILVLATLFVLVSAFGVFATPNETVDSILTLTGNIPTSTIFFAVAGEPDTGSIELEPNATTLVSCWGTAEDLDGLSDLNTLSSVIYADGISRFADNNESNHYTNNSCFTDWPTSGDWNCTFNVQYYADPSDWTCAVNITNQDLQYYNDTINTTSTVEDLIALEVHNKTVNFGLVAVDIEYPADTEVVVYNTGNVVLNLSLDAANSSVAFDLDDPTSFNCTIGDVPVENLRFSLTQGTAWNVAVPMVEVGTTAAQNFNLAPQVGGNSMGNLPVFDSTWWSIMVPSGIAGTCTGQIMFIGQTS